MNNDKENDLWDNVYKEVVKQYPNKSIKFITKQALIIFKKIKNENPKEYKPVSIKSSSSKKHKRKKKRRSSTRTTSSSKKSGKKKGRTSKKKKIKKKTN
jgi:hypothetical protein